MIKKIAAVFTAVVMTIALAGCSYVMTEEDLAIQKSIEGYWAADNKTGYNTYDENGIITSMMVVEFVDEFKYVLHVYDVANQMVMSYPPIDYSFEDKKFKVDVEGVASYAEMRVSEDGNTLYWITDDRTDVFVRIPEETAREMKIPEYDPAMWAETEDASSESEGSSETVSE